MTKQAILSLLLAGLVALPAFGQRKAGRNGAAFLEIGVGAREVALGSASTALSGEANQVFWNPAGTALAADQKLSASFSYNSWIADITGAALALGYNAAGGTFTLGVQTFGLSDIPANRQNGYVDPVLQGLVTDLEEGDTFDYRDLAVSLSYARYFFDRLSLGATVKVVNESIDGASANAVAFDFGSVYKVGFAGWQIAARLNNLGTPLQFSGDVGAGTSYGQKNPLPLNFSIGTSIYPVNTEKARLMLALDTIKPQDSQQLLYGGAELSFYDLLFLRGGYKFNYSGTQDSGNTLRDPVDITIEDFSLGGGIQYQMSGYGVAVDYAFTKMDLLDNVHRITLRVGL